MVGFWTIRFFCHENKSYEWYVTFSIVIQMEKWRTVGKRILKMLPIAMVSHGIDVKWLESIARQISKYQFIQRWNCNIAKSVCRIYNYVKLWLWRFGGRGGGVIHILPQKLKNTLINYRIANHLAIENGRYY